MTCAPPEVSVVIVNHRSAAESARCVASLREDFRTTGIAGEVVLVDCASGGEERRRLEQIGVDELLLLDENRGYSGGLNAGLARARSRRLVLSNADVVYRPGATAALLDAIADPAVGAAAPLTTWDEAGRILLPPGFAPGFWTDLAQVAAGRWRALDDWRFAGFARRTLALWRCGGPTRHLAGAVLAARRDVFDRVGRFDERFPFEYEETEWEERLRRADLKLVVEPRASVRHVWARSALRNPETRVRRAVSERRYRNRRYGRWARALLDSIPSAEPALLPRLDHPRVEASPGNLLAVSPNSSRLPFAGTPLEQDFELPGEIVEGLSPGFWRFTVFRGEDGRPLHTRVWENAA